MESILEVASLLVGIAAGSKSFVTVFYLPAISDSAERDVAYDVTDRSLGLGAE